jgi:hypothetical protein
LCAPISTGATPVIICPFTLVWTGNGTLPKSMTESFPREKKIVLIIACPRDAGVFVWAQILKRVVVGFSCATYISSNISLITKDIYSKFWLFCRFFNIEWNGMFEFSRKNFFEAGNKKFQKQCHFSIKKF